MGADYLLYSLLDVIVDNYFLIVEDLGERIEALEAQDQRPRPEMRTCSPSRRSAAC
jgi:magnesium transporter